MSGSEGAISGEAGTSTAGTPGTNTTDTSTNSGTTGRQQTDRSSSRFSGHRGHGDIDRNWLGEELGIGAVLGLRVERLTKKVSFDAFCTKLTNYVLREVKNAADVVPVISNMVDPRIDFFDKHAPKSLNEKEKQNDVRVAIQEQRIKLYASREAAITEKMNKIYGLIKG
jgi:hypothetical protein